MSDEKTIKIDGFTNEFIYLNGFLLTHQYLNISDLSIYKKFEAREDDVIIASFPKSGTTWVQELVYVIRNDCNFDDASTASIEERIPFIENDFPGIDFVKNMKAPRTLKTHLPLSFFPDNFQNKCKVIYVIRNPKDVVVSYFHFMKLCKMITCDFKDFLKYFKSGEILYGPWWKHVDDCVQERVHVIQYEDLHLKPRETLIALGEFVGKKLNEEKITAILEWCSFSNMKKNPAINYDDKFKEMGVFEKEGSFFRKGIIGDWQTHFSEEEAAEFDDIIKKNLKCYLKLNA